MTTITTRSGKGSPLTNAEVDDNFTNLNDDKVETSGDSMTGNLSFGDNNKVILGASSDLQIYHSGTESWVKDTGTGSLYIDTDGTSVLLTSGNSAKNMVSAVKDGAVTLYNDNTARLATTSTGIDVTGSVTADDSMLVEGASGSTLTLKNTTTGAGQDVLIGAVDFFNSDASGEGPSVQARIKAVTANAIGNGADLQFFTTSASGGSEGDPPVQRMEINQLGDISFYNSAGTSQDLYWDASTSRLGLGTTSPNRLLHLNTTSGTDGRIHFTNATTGTTTSDGFFIGQDSGDGNVSLWNFESNYMRFATGNVERIRIDSSGNTGFGTSAPVARVQVAGTGSTNLIVQRTNANGSYIGMTDSSGNFGYVGINNGDMLLLTPGSNYASKLTISSAGNIGMSNNIPDSFNAAANRLVVGSGITNQGLTIYSSPSHYGSIHFADGVTGSESYRGYIWYSHITDEMAFGTAGSERVRIDSSGLLGIGTSLPASALHVVRNTNNYVARFENTDATSPYTVWIREPASASSGYPLLNITDNAGTDTYFRVDSGSGNVGIGITPQSFTNLMVKTATDRNVSIFDNATGATVSGLTDAGASTALRLAGFPLIFTGNGGSGSEAMRIDSSGSLLVGKTTTAFTTAGTSINQSGVAGKVHITRSGGEPLALNRLSNDGTLIELYQANSIVGSISTEGGDLAIGNDDAGIQFVNGNEHFRPFNVTTNSSTDALMDIGSSSKRFKDLYLSNAVRNSGGELKCIASTNIRNQGSVHTWSNAAGSTEYGRFDSSGNLLVGKTASSIATEGVTLGPNGQHYFTSDNETALKLNRLTTDGEIIQLRKDSAIVGSIATNSSRFEIDGSGNPVRMKAGTSNIQVNNNTHISFDTAGSEAMRIDSSGNVLVGKTAIGSTTDGFEARASGYTALSDTSGAALNVNRNSTDGAIVTFTKDGTTVGSIGTGSGLLTIGTGTGNLLFENALVAPCSNSSLGASDGVVDLGASTRRFKDLYLSNAAYLDKVIGHDDTNTYISFIGSDVTQFVQGGAEAMRISSSGALLVNTTTTNFSPQMAVQKDSGGYVFESVRTGTGTEGHIVFVNGNGAVGTITSTGTSTAYGTSSDQRLKENIVDAPSASDDIDAIQVRSFDWKADGSHQKYGMVAQELQTVAPEAVTEGETEEDMMSVDYSKLVPMLVKEIQSLRARVAQLETN